MKTDVRSLWPALAPALLVFVLLSPPASAQKAAQQRPASPKAPAKVTVQPPPPPSGKTDLQDRVLAVVDEDPILASDVERVIRLGLDQPQPGEADERFRRRVLDDLIDERLRFHEVDRFNFEQVPVEDIQKRVAEIRSRYPDEASFKKALKDVGLDEKGLRQLVARQLLVLTYVDEKLGAKVFVEPDEINRYYRDVLTPEMRKRGQQPPPVDEVREDIRETLKQQKMTQEMTRLTRDLRSKADIVVYSGNPKPNQPLPPVVKTFQGKPGAKPEGKKAPAGQKPPGALY
jgi:peptidyl-prolyl cis-trans isomerase SurA